MMRVEARLHRRRAIQLWILSMTMSAAFNAQALGLGEIQVKSILGEPLKARVNVFDLSYADAHDFRVRLAGIDEYKRAGLQYPDGIKFYIQFVNEQGKQPYIDISTLRSIEEPFLSLLVEITSASGYITKDFTFLIDPPPDLMRAAIAVQPATVAQPVEAAGEKTESASASMPEEALPVVSEESVARSAKPKKRKKREAVPVWSGASARAADESLSEAKAGQTSQVPGKLALSLSTSLSISRYEQRKPGYEGMNRDQMQEELIAKEKTLGELTAQLAEMQQVIKLLQLKLGIQAGSAAAQSGVLAQGAAPGGGATGKPKISVPGAAAKADKSSGASSYWQKIVAGIVLLLLGATAFLSYRKYTANQKPKRGTFDDLGTPELVVSEDDVAGALKTAGELPLKTPGNKELKTASISSPEYDLLEQAETYLRFGHDKLAEDVLRQAIKINPINPHGYLALLGIYETRGDVKAFNALAQQLKAVGDAADWKRVAESGRKLDPENPFYA